MTLIYHPVLLCFDVMSSLQNLYIIYKNTFPGSTLLRIGGITSWLAMWTITSFDRLAFFKNTTGLVTVD